MSWSGSVGSIPAKHGPDRWTALEAAFVHLLPACTRRLPCELRTCGDYADVGIIAIALQSRRCCTGIAAEKMSDAVYPSYPRISVTPMSLIPTGT